MGYILAIDQGTTSSRAIVFDAEMRPIAMAQQEFPQIFPASGWVEHAPDTIWNSVLATCQMAIKQAGIDAGQLAGIGLTNQRETTLIWDRKTGAPIGNAIVWQDRRTAARCTQLAEQGHEALIAEKTGLLLDPYFSATKAAWLLDNTPGARARAQAGQLAFGTVDSWLIWNLTGGRIHATDATNAARTMLYDIHTGTWCDTLCQILDVPRAMLPEIHDCAAQFGTTDAALLGAAVPILGVAGDQQAAAIGQACFTPGMMKSTYGTGCFALLNTGATPVRSKNRLLGTVAYQLQGQRCYALEGSIFVAGAVVQWLRDGLGLIAQASDTQALAERADRNQDVVIVPAFTGLGAPHWQPDSRGAIFGLTRATGPAELARAALESIGFQTLDLLQAMQADWPDADATGQAILRVDGGMCASNWAMQFLADITGLPVDRPALQETTALGAAWLAGMQAGVWPGMVEFAKTWALEHRFTPEMAGQTRSMRHARWQRAVAATLAV